MNYLYYQFWTKESLSCNIWNQNPWICLIEKYREIMKMPKCGSKNALFGYFCTRTSKNYYRIWNQQLQISVIAKFCEETKMSKFGTKNTWFGYFGTGIWKQYCHIWNQYPRICLIAKFCEKTKIRKLGPKNVLFGYFLARILKHFCHSWNQHLRISVIAKFCEGTKMSKFESKNANFGYFWPKIPYLDIFGQELKKKLLSDLKSALSNLSIFKISRKKPKFGTKMVIFEISTLKFVKNESLNHTVNFGIESTFSNGPWSAFSEGRSPGPGLLYKVCLCQEVPLKWKNCL